MRSSAKQALRGALVVLAWMMVWAAPSVARAEGAERARQEVAALITQANALYAQGQLKEALPLYVRAHHASKDPALIYRMGQIHEALGNYERAASYTARYMREAPTSPYLDRIDARRESLLKRAKTEQAYLSVSSSPPGARVVIDGVAEAGATPLRRIPVTHGEVTLVIRLSDGRTREESVSIAPGTTTERQYTFDVVEAPKPAEQPKPKPVETPKPRPKPAEDPQEREIVYPYTTVNLAPPGVLNGAAWLGLTTAPIALFMGFLFSELNEPGIATTLYVYGAAGLIGGGYVLFIHDWSAGRYPAVGDPGAPRLPGRGALRPSRAFGPGVRFDF